MYVCTVCMYIAMKFIFLCNHSAYVYNSIEPDHKHCPRLATDNEFSNLKSTTLNSSTLVNNNKTNDI